ncbi:MAG TPA: DegT/DnrJ/EryC1/StrS family aminotransferase [Bacteroidales bacterium]|nr:DegT/DnrJ/EryC1/StrS family aminotransferase [Bacteroidales bacterium]
MIPFSPPRIDKIIIDAVVETLKSGWITTGAKTKFFEKAIADYSGCKAALALNSATAGLEIMLRWFGVKDGDEVIVPAYTYCATANVVIHCGAKPVFVDVNSSDFNISLEALEKAITKRTKVIMPVDLGGFPVDIDEINKMVKNDNIKKLFKPQNKIQKKLGRIMILLDAAHSFGAVYKGKRVGCLTDITVFSFHAVKNLTTAEGGAICLNLPVQFNNEEIYNFLSMFSLHGQTKDAYSKAQKGNWRYDVIEAGYKANMTDILSSIGLVEIQRYDNDTMIRRRHIFDKYTQAFKNISWAQPPIYETKDKISSFHVYLLRIKGINESQRNEIINRIFDNDVSVNVHFQPLPLLSYYKNLGYSMLNYPVAYDNYSREISLPVFYDLSDEQINIVINVVIESVNNVLGF